MTAEQPDRKEYWETELESLGIDPHTTTELNDTEELAKLAENIKQVYYQDFKTAYGKDGERLEATDFDHII